MAKSTNKEEAIILNVLSDINKMIKSLGNSLKRSKKYSKSIYGDTEIIISPPNQIRIKLLIPKGDVVFNFESEVSLSKKDEISVVITMFCNHTGLIGRKTKFKYRFDKDKYSKKRLDKAEKEILSWMFIRLERVCDKANIHI